MRSSLALLLAAVLSAGSAQAQTRIIAQNNGWTAYDGTADGRPVCGLETRDPQSGRHLLMQHVGGQEGPVIRLSRPSWNLPVPSTRMVRIVIDNRQVFTANGTASGNGQELAWRLDLERFESAFRLGRVVRVEFPNGPDTPWHLSLTGTNAVMSAFLGCLRMMVIQPGEAPPPGEASPGEAPADLPRRGLPEDKPDAPGKPSEPGKPVAL